MQAISKWALGLFFSAGLTGTAHAQTLADIVDSYSDLAHVTYADSLAQARQLHEQIELLLTEPSPESLAAARQQWLDARVPYQQTEAFRFGNPVVDDWEGQVNAWPLDEGFIDYVEPTYFGQLGNPGANANIIASDSITVGAKTVATDPITPELLASLNELAGSEANVATGYHAIEFLLWGQDTNADGPGNRPYTDFALGAACTNAACERRREYLRVVTQLLVDDLSYITEQWAAQQPDNYRAELAGLEPTAAVTRILFSIGSLALGELAGERMLVALEANSAEDEHDCFSDNTHNAHFYSAQGISNVYFAEYRGTDGKSFKGDSLADYIAQRDNQLAQTLQHQLAETKKALAQMVRAAEDSNSPMSFDTMILEGNHQGAAMINHAIEELTKTTELIEQLARALGINNLNPSLAAN